LAALFALATASCASNTADFVTRHAPLAGLFAFETTVYRDQAPDSDLSWQVGEFAQLLEQRNVARRRFPGTAEPLPTILRITERSYVVGLDVKTSIYGELRVHDQNERVLLMHTYYTLGTATLLSAKTQERVVRKLLGRALARQRRAVR
jgi:hypothetical protein